MSTSIPSNARIYVAGHRGLVGSAILRALGKAGHKNILTATREQLDLRNQAAVNNWFKDKVDLSKTADLKIARVISVNKNSFVVSNGVKDIYAELAGKFLFNSEDSLDLPAVGDWVYAQLFDDNELAIIHDMLPRKSLLKRKASGKKVDYQLIQLV